MEFSANGTRGQSETEKEEQNMNVNIKLATLALAAATLSACQSGEQSISWVDYGDDPMANPEFMQDWQAAGSPTEAHNYISKLAGTWNVTGHFWMKPGGEAMPTTATSTSRMILDGRYLMENYSSDFMGMPFNGVLIQGYDNIKEQYFTIWMDNMSTRPMMSEGTRDEEGTLTTTGHAYDVMTPNGRPMRTVITEKSENEYVMQMFDNTQTGEEFMSMELTYTR